MTQHTLFTGCSYTAGSGFDLAKDEPGLWVNLLHQKIFTDTTLLNLGRGGRSNAGIFQDTVTALLSYSVRYAVIQWTSMPRYELDLGFELYPTAQSFMPNGQCRDHNLNQINYTSGYLNSIRDRFTSLAHDYNEILNLIEYTNSIRKLAHCTKTQIFFVNGICPWDQDFFVRKTNVLPDQYTPYTQKILFVNNRDDSEIFQLYDKMHSSFEHKGSVNQSDWLNLYSSMRSQIVDRNADNQHPGLESNQLYADQFAAEITNKI